MPYLRKWIYSGNVIESAEYYSLRVPKSLRWDKFGTRPLRGKNHHVTPEQMQKLNNRNAVVHLCRLMNMNFGPSDIFITCDLREVPLLPDGDLDEGKLKDYIAKYNRKLRREYRKAGITFKYIWVIEKETEKGPVRPHVHMLLPKFSLDKIVDAWDYGGCTIRRLDCNRDYKGIANYLSKDPTLGTNHKKRWGASQNLKQPYIPPPKRILYPGGPVKTPKGYKQIIDRAYWSDITGMSRYIRFVKLGGADYTGWIMQGTRAGPDPIPFESNNNSA